MKLLPPSSYAAYRAGQRRKYRRKRNHVWINRREWDFLAKTIRECAGELIQGICHGVRKGIECDRLSELLEIPVIGTEIGNPKWHRVVSNWDFHKTKPEWNEQFSFVYSNALDHSYDPSLALATWATQLHVNGIMVLHWATDDLEPSSSEDCFGATLEEYSQLVGVHCSDVRLVPSPVKKGNRTLVVGRRNETLYRDPRVG